MYKDKKTVYFFYFLIDIFLIGLSFYSAYLLFNRHTVLSATSSRDYYLTFSLWTIVLIFILNNYNLYTTDRAASISSETFRVVKAVFYSSLLAILIIFWLKIEILRLVFLYACLFLTFSLSLWRIIKRIWVRHLILEGNLNVNVLVLGAGKSGLGLVEEIQNNPYFGLRVVGFLDDTKVGEVGGFRILGKLNDLENVARKHYVDEIYVTIPSERQKVADILLKTKKLGKTARILADNFNSFYFGRIRLNYIGTTPLLIYYEKELHGTERYIKRFLDLLIVGCGLILLTPLFIIIAILIKLDSPGPVFYISPRLGRRGKVFNFYKFRSMLKGADKYKETLRSKSEVKGPIFKIKNDPRITQMGRFLRKYSLDELPQLINVIKGDMSLVGPRPPTPDEVAKYDFWQMRRLEVRPGLTCLWQVRGRSDLSFYKWVKWDLWYIDNWSLDLDLMIILWTIPAVLKRKGAY